MNHLVCELNLIYYITGIHVYTPKWLKTQYNQIPTPQKNVYVCIYSLTQNIINHKCVHVYCIHMCVYAYMCVCDAHLDVRTLVYANTHAHTNSQTRKYA